MIDHSKLEGYSEAQIAIAENTTPRALYMAQLEAWADGSQYDGRPSWWDTSVPLWDRAPCVVYPVVQTSVASNTDLVLGEGRWPLVTSSPDEDDTDFDDDALDEESSKLIDRTIAEVHRVTRFRVVTKQCFRSAQTCGTGVMLFGVRDGRVFAETTKARWCEPELDSHGRVLRLVIQYPYLECYRRNDGKRAVRAMLYRRVIDDVSDTTMLPAVARADGHEPKWTPDPKLTVQHGLGFCPVVWYAFDAEISTVEEIDGHAVHALILDEIRAHDFVNSMHHRAALYAGDPQWTETGVDLGSNPSSTGKVTEFPATLHGGGESGANPRVGVYRTGPARSTGRRKGSGEVWQYENDKTKVELHTLPGDALKALDDNAHGLRMMLCHVLAVVDLDPENIKFAATTSGKALEAIKQRQIDRCDTYRDDVGDKLIIPATEMLLRILATRGEQVCMRGKSKWLAVLRKLGETVCAGALSLKWGTYFKPDALEDQQMVTTSVTAYDAGLITRRMAVQKLRRVYGIENVDQALEQIEAEAQERAQKQAEAFHAYGDDATGRGGSGASEDAAGAADAGGARDGRAGSSPAKPPPQREDKQRA